MSPEYGTLTRLPGVRNRSPLTLYSRAPENGFWRQRRGRHRRVQGGDISVSPVEHFLCRPVTHRKGRRFSGGLGARRIQDEWLVVDAVLRNQSQAANSLFSAGSGNFSLAAAISKICPTEKRTTCQCINPASGA